MAAREPNRDGVPILVGSTTQQLQPAMNAFDEAWLQKLLFDHPECLPIHDIEPGFDNLISICRELPTPHGSIDNLFMTRSGDIVVVETKLWRNPQARREVLAQALDYASCLFEMSYSDFQNAVLKASHGQNARPKSLFSMFPESDAIPESSFVDAVSFNLSRGRIVILIVGDGIRAETERIAAALQSHAGFHFTFALVELAVFKIPDGGGLLVLPRTLAKTIMIERGIVRVEGDGVRIGPPKEALAPTTQTASITAEQFFDAMGIRNPELPSRLKQFISDLEPLGVSPDFQRSLIFRWDTPSGGSINLGYIQRDGLLWTGDALGSIPRELSNSYIEDLAETWGMEVDRNFSTAGSVRDKGKVPKIESLMGKLNGWRSVIERFIQQFNRHQSKND